MRAIQKLKQHPKRTEPETHSRLPTTKHRHHPTNIIPFPHINTFSKLVVLLQTNPSAKQPLPLQHTTATSYPW